jgi:tetraacyldisaccharide 4'-kinase
MTGKTDTRLKRLFFLGRPFSPLYSLLMKTRSSFYQKGFFKQHKLEVPVISVGNLVIGGTGKTPLVQYIVKLLQQQNRKPVILSRGYKGTAADAINVVSNTTDILLNAAEAGDEPRLLAEKLPGVPVVTGKKRFFTGRFAIDSFGADTLILDDGFQHLALKRDLNLVLFSNLKGLGKGRVLPGGELREPLSALKRASAFVITGITASPDSKAQKFISQLDNLYPEKPLFTASYQADKDLLRIHNGKNDSISQADAGRIPLYSFCGIAGPKSFKMTLEKNGMNLTGFREFADHHIYSAADIKSLLDQARNSGAEGLVTTEKDLVKLRSIFPPEMLLLVQPVQLHLPEAFDRFIISNLSANLNPDDE